MTVSVRVEHKNMSLAKIQRRHDLRLLGESTPKHIDKSKSADNSVIIEDLKEGELKKICLERRASVTHKRAMKSSAAVSSIGIITFGKEAQSVIKSLSVAEQNSLYLKTAEAVAKELNTSLTGLVVHRDEASPHAHFQMPAVSLSGKPTCKVLGDKQSFAKLQDLVGEVYKELGINRGTPKKTRIANGEDYSKTVHRSVRKLHDDLPVDIAKKQEQLNELERQAAEQQAKLDKNQRLLERTMVKITESDSDFAKIKKNADIYESRAAKAKANLFKILKIAKQVRLDIQKQESEFKKREEDLAKKEEVVEQKNQLHIKFANEFIIERELINKTAEKILSDVGVVNKKINPHDVLKIYSEYGMSAVKSQFKISMTR